MNEHEYLKSAEKAVRDQEQIDVNIQQSAKMVADFHNTLTDNGLSEMAATGLTTVWMAKVLGN